MRKSRVTSRSSLPSGASSCQATSCGFSPALDAEILAQHAVAGAEQVLEEILVPLARRAEQVGAPDEQVARPVRGIVRVVAGHLELARASAPRPRSPSASMPRRLGACRDGRAGWLELRRRRQPAHAFGAHVVVDQRCRPVAVRRRRRQDFLDVERLVAPLVGVRVEERGARSCCRGGRLQSSPKASGSQPVCGRSFSCPT